MEVRAYDGEYFERGNLWYISFVTFLSFFIIVSLFIQNFSGVIVLFLLIGGYILLHLLPAGRKIKISYVEEGLKLGGSFYPWNSVNGFVLEIDQKTQKLKNIVFIIGPIKAIHTFADNTDNIKSFVLGLGDIIPMLDGYEQSFLDKMVRKLKI